MKTRALVLSLAALAGLAACSPQVKAPFDRGVCYSVVLPEEGSKAAPTFNVVARDQPQMEHCAARLEEMRLRFIALGGSNRDIVGSYQGKFIFIDATGVKVGDTLTGGRYFFLARAPGGRLAIPGAIQRDVDGRPVAVAESPPAGG